MGIVLKYRKIGFIYKFNNYPVELKFASWGGQSPIVRITYVTFKLLMMNMYAFREAACYS